jgi:hypothetical protein
MQIVIGASRQPKPVEYVILMLNSNEKLLALNAVSCVRESLTEIQETYLVNAASRKQLLITA